MTDQRFQLIESTDENDPLLPAPESIQGGDVPSVLPIVDETYGGVIAWANTTEQGKRIVDALSFAEDRDEILGLLAALVLFAPSRQTTTLPFATAVVKACDVLSERSVRLSPNDVRDLADRWLAEMPADVQSALLRSNTKGETP